ncbi:RDD family protein [Acetonema longum]|uniref:Peptidase S41 n=1 Tax=Acetonema longum DSM 6540 TaxID=1009370 RepID=F7NDZ9_9FIRM|nr:RDD family protein [Acetonema longum]EGO65753.1 peptidase S41 [Acetonema longum DSM 6540]
MIPEPVITEPFLADRPHSWFRFFARKMDLILFGFSLGIIRAAIFGTDEATAPFKELIMVMLMSIVLESVLLSLFGTTPGKWLFNIRIVNAESGTKPSLSQSLRRSVKVWLIVSGWASPSLSWLP